VIIILSARPGPTSPRRRAWYDADADADTDTDYAGTERHA